MKKVTVKILVSLTLGFFLITLIPRLFFRFFTEIEIIEIINSRIFGYGMAMTAFLSLIVFFIIMNQLVVKRIKRLNLAVNQVAHGNYDLHIESNGKDEISTLTNHFNQMVGELKEKEKMNQEFLRNFAHEFKTPIATFKGYADLILSEDSSIEEIHGYAKIISDEALRLTELSKHMLFMSRIDAETIIRHGEPYDLSHQLRSIIQLMQLQWESKGISFDLELEPVTLDIDQAYTYHILLNLITNAIKFSKPNGTITCTISKTQDQIEIKIKDNGIGMDPVQIEKIFEPFYMADSSHQSHGSGIGLTLVKRIVDHMGGDIHVSSKKNEYTSFDIKIKA